MGNLSKKESDFWRETGSVGEQRGLKGQEGLDKVEEQV